jgi:Peptidase family M23
MHTTRTHTAGRRIAASALLVVFLSLACVAVGTAARGGSSAEGCTGTYGWPVKPFDRAHPIRGSFGDPRTLFNGPPTRQTLLTSSGRFNFHQGVDVSAPNGEPVYAVADGVVTRVTREWVGVDCGNGRSFEYWHVTAKVRVGQRVAAGESLIGFIQRPSGHVHLTHLEDGISVNPVARGRLAPYEDTTEPQILGIALRRTDGDHDEMPHFVRGSVQMVVEAVDEPALRVQGLWQDLPVTPARITWRIEKWTGRVVVKEQVARDVRERLPDSSRFWATFARGSYQNFAVFGRHYSYLQAGRYLFRLSSQPFDTRRLRDGVYALVVSASDIAGNRDVQRLRFTVHNRDGWR